MRKCLFLLNYQEEFLKMSCSLLKTFLSSEPVKKLTEQLSVTCLILTWLNLENFLWFKRWLLKKLQSTAQTHSQAISEHKIHNNNPCTPRYSTNEHIALSNKSRKGQNPNIILSLILSKETMLGIIEHYCRSTWAGSPYHGVLQRHYNECKVLIWNWRSLKTTEKAYESGPFKPFLILLTLSPCW